MILSYMSLNPWIIDAINAGRYNQRVLLVFLGLLVFLLSLFAVAFQFGRDAGIFKKLPVVVIAISALVIPSRAAAQITTPDQSSPAAPPANEPPETAEPPAPSQGPRVSDRPVSWKLLFRNVIADQKQIWSFPARLVQGQKLDTHRCGCGDHGGTHVSRPERSRDISAPRRHFMGSRTLLRATPRRSAWVRFRPRCMPSG